VIFLKFYQQKITFLFFFTTDFENALLFKGVGGIKQQIV
jgi:hypothetical protein